MNITNKYQVAGAAAGRGTAINKRRIVTATILGGVLLLAGLFIFSRLGGDRAETAGSTGGAVTSPSAPVEVSSTAAVTQQVTAFVQATGSLSGDETSDVASQASGQVVATPVDVGEVVRQGAVIARLDDREARMRFQRAQAAERQAAAALSQSQARLGMGPGGSFDPNAIPEVQAARRSAEAAEAQARLAEANARRYENLFETGDVSRSVYEQYRTQAETARAEANAARQQLGVAINTARSGMGGISAAEASLSAARAETALAQKAVNDTIIKAPMSGYVSDRPVAVGEYVTPASKIATIVKTNPIKVNLLLPEAEAGRVRIGMPVTLSVAAYADRQFSGSVTAINPVVDPQSRAMTVEGQIENSANLLRPGMFVTARIIQPGGSVGVFVPREAVLTDPATNSSMVFVIEGDTARVRVVQLGQEKDGLVQIISGVKAEEVVAISNLQQLFDGARVRRK